MQLSFKQVPYPWIVLTIALAGQAALASGINGLPVLYPFIQDEFGLSRAQVGLITSAVTVGAIFTAPLGGWLTDTLGVKRVAAFTLIIGAGILGAFPLSYTLPSFVVLIILLGFIEGPVYPATSRAVIDWLPRRSLGLAMSIKQSGVPLGGALTAAILPVLTIAIGWRISGALIGLLFLSAGFLFLLLYKDKSLQTHTKLPRRLLPLHEFKQNRSLLIVTIWSLAFAGLQFTVLTYFVLFLVQELHTSPVIAGGLLATAQIGSFAARILWGAASDFIFGGRRISVLGIIGILGSMGLIGMSLLGTDTPGPVLFLLAIVIGITVLSWHGVFTVAIGEMADPQNIATTIGAVSAIMRIGMILIPPLFGLLIDVSGSYQFGWRLAASLALLSTITLLIIRGRNINIPGLKSQDMGEPRLRANH